MSQHGEDCVNIVTSYNPLCHRWSAWVDGDEETVGTGDTKQEAVDNLCEKLEIWPPIVAE